jgi:hypothetical protein
MRQDVERIPPTCISDLTEQKLPIREPPETLIEDPIFARLDPEVIEPIVSIPPMVAVSLMRVMPPRTVPFFTNND